MASLDQVEALRLEVFCVGPSENPPLAAPCGPLGPLRVFGGGGRGPVAAELRAILRGGAAPGEPRDSRLPLRRQSEPHGALRDDAQGG